ncbi:hypothetical protein [Streptomyces sp. NBC_01276]|uniref:hypothetical protein n=1 Tax=Streptomyces sp. NBC_01276 TaxID=2903808 RepID=UPI00352CA823
MVRIGCAVMTGQHTRPQDAAEAARRADDVDAAAVQAVRTHPQAGSTEAARPDRRRPPGGGPFPDPPPTEEPPP